MFPITYKLKYHTFDQFFLISSNIFLLPYNFMYTSSEVRIVEWFICSPVGRFHQHNYSPLKDKATLQLAPSMAFFMFYMHSLLNWIERGSFPRILLITATLSNLTWFFKRVETANLWQPALCPSLVMYRTYIKM